MLLRVLFVVLLRVLFVVAGAVVIVLVANVVGLCDNNPVRNVQAFFEGVLLGAMLYRVRGRTEFDTTRNLCVRTGAASMLFLYREPLGVIVLVIGANVAVVLCYCAAWPKARNHSPGKCADCGSRFFSDFDRPVQE